LLKQFKILFIDDDPIAKALIEAIFDFYRDDFHLNSIERIYAENLKEAAEKLDESINEGNFINGILCDIQLIEETGFDFLQLYNNEYLKDYPKTVVSLITAHISDNTIEDFKNFPFAYKIFERPIDVKKLKILIKEIIRRHS